MILLIKLELNIGDGCARDFRLGSFCLLKERQHTSYYKDDLIRLPHDFEGGFVTKKCDMLYQQICMCLSNLRLGVPFFSW